MTKTSEMRQPRDIDAERAVLVAIMRSGERYADTAGQLADEHFSLDTHRAIFRAMAELHEGGSKIDTISINSALQASRPGLFPGGALSFLLDLETGVPEFPNIDTYIRRLRDRAALRDIQRTAHSLLIQSSEPDAEPAELIEQMRGNAGKLAESLQQSDLATPASIIEAAGGINSYLDRKTHSPGLQTGYRGLDLMTGGVRPGALYILAARPAMGKAQPLDAPIKTIDGWKQMGDIRLGDQIASVDDGFSEVVGVFPQGKRTTYRVTFDDGRSTECCGEHLWRVYHRGSGWRTVDTHTLIGLVDKPHNRRRFSVPLATGDFGSQEPLPVDPWLLGVLLGDGCLRRNVRFSSADEELVLRVKETLGAYDVVHGGGYNYRISAKATERPRYRTEQRDTPNVREGWKPRGLHNPLIESLRQLGLMGCGSFDKFIPDCYLNADAESRLELLRGLLDTDGTVEKSGTPRYCTVSERLAHDVQRLAWSVGAICKVRRRKQSFILTIRHTDQSSLFWLPRKRARLVPRRHSLRLPIIRIDEVRETECQCIAVSHPSKLYITNDYIVTHNTALAMNIVERMAVDQQNTALVFSLEMSKDELLSRMICSRAKVDSRRFDEGVLHTEEIKRVNRAAGEIAGCGRIHISDKAGTNTDEIHGVIRRHQARYGKVGLVVIDYLQLMLKCRADERVAAMSQISRDAKLIAKDCKVPVLALSQLSRACEARGSDSNVEGYRPLLSDLRESGSIEQDADLVASIFRGEVYLRHKPEALGMWRGLADLEVLKQRSGPTGIVPLVFLSESVRFEERA